MPNPNKRTRRLFGSRFREKPWHGHQQTKSDALVSANEIKECMDDAPQVADPLDLWKQEILREANETKRFDLVARAGDDWELLARLLREAGCSVPDPPTR